jgi:hypothetical protein
MADDPMRTAADDIVSYCTDEANRHHGYDAICTAVDHDLANAYSRIADEVERLAAAGLPAAPDQGHDKTAGRAESPLVSSLAESPFIDLTARLAAADAGWGLASGDGPSNPDYIRWLAAQVEAFEGHTSPAAPADDEAAAQKGWEAFKVAYSDYEKKNPNWRAFWTDHHAYAFAAALAALREGKQQ